MQTSSFGVKVMAYIYGAIIFTTKSYCYDFYLEIPNFLQSCKFLK